MTVLLSKREQRDTNGRPGRSDSLSRSANPAGIGGMETRTDAHGKLLLSDCVELNQVDWRLI